MLTPARTTCLGDFHAWVAGGHLEVREVELNRCSFHAKQLADFGPGLILLQVQSLYRLGFRVGFFRKPLGPPALVPPGPSLRHARFGPFANDVALELSQRGKEVKHEPGQGRSRVQVVGQAHEVDTFLLKFGHQQHQVFERAAPPVDFPDHKRTYAAGLRVVAFESGHVPCRPGFGKMQGLPVVVPSPHHAAVEANTVDERGGLIPDWAGAGQRGRALRGGTGMGKE